MSSFRTIEVTCGLCGHTFQTRIVMSPNAFGSSDLDMRPPQMQRSTMPLWIDVCPCCHYVHEDIEQDGKRHKRFVRSRAYKRCEGNQLESGLAQKFYRYGMILRRDGEPVSAYAAFLHAAWASDDAEDLAGATLCRNKAIALFDPALFRESDLKMRHIDVLRRAGRFSEAIGYRESAGFVSERMNKLADFEKKLAEARDRGCYRVADCPME